MYNFHYDVIVKRYGDNARLLFTDTDSLCYCITTNNLYEDLIDINDEWLDTSEYPKDHPLYSARNAKVLGKMKDECAGDYVEEFVGLRSKIYSLLACNPTHSKKTAKGVKSGFVKKHVKHAMYKKTLIDRKCTYANFVSFRSRCHKIESVHIHRTCLSAYDDKRFVLPDGISTLAYGHFALRG